MSTPFLIPVSGRGRPDYSMSIQRSVSPTTIQQSQIGVSATFTAPSLVYPFVYPFIIGMKAPTGEIPQGYPIVGYNVIVTGDTNADTVVGVQIWQDVDISVPGVTGSPFKTIFVKHSPHVAELQASRGFDVGQFPGKYLMLLMAHYSANPFATLTISIHGIIDISIADANRLRLL